MRVLFVGSVLAASVYIYWVFEFSLESSFSSTTLLFQVVSSVESESNNNHSADLAQHLCVFLSLLVSLSRRVCVNDCLLSSSRLCGRSSVCVESKNIPNSLAASLFMSLHSICVYLPKLFEPRLLLQNTQAKRKVSSKILHNV